ncbi:MAG: hypothetical protein WBL11_00285 [Bacteroidales bacterium]|nr:hypothetical protein [Bacteroidales bacterium]MDI9574918.1 hypothetical protein [Bacteroidota bacterium]MDY0400765.1 hypothetical protein [Bacteroidales bacterium]HHW59269.1 hypothetical protein [Bacteroidales bacterium]HOB77349.1 hypothetical protein [Bacteroidales bacterium]
MNKKGYFFVIGIIGGIILCIILIYAFLPRFKNLVYQPEFFYYSDIIDEYEINKKRSFDMMESRFRKLYKSNFKLLINDSINNNNNDSLTSAKILNIKNKDTIFKLLYYNILDSLLKISGYKYVDSITLDSLVKVMILDSIEKIKIDSTKVFF